jgi:acetate kinase
MDAAAQSILTFNAGSSSLRFAVFDADCARSFEGKFERIGRPEARLILNGEESPRAVALATHADCLPVLYQLLEEQGVGIPAVISHRVVHGGPDHFEATAVTPALLGELQAITSFAPNHLPAAIALMEAAQERWPGVPQIACFDTAFHRDLPPAARLLPLPRRFAAQGIRRYGFHGLAFSSVLAELQHRTGGRIPSRLILAHLGHGASLAAVRSGRCVDTTMGFTPVGGLVMSTRTGDLDPGVLAFLAAREKLSPAALEELVSRQSGLLGLSDVSSDTRELLEKEATHPGAAEALAVFVHQARKAIGACAATLGGLDAIVFSGGIGENSVVLRARLCAHFEYLDLILDPALNAANAPIISAAASRVMVYVIPADEESTLATTARDFLSRQPAPRA